MYGYRQAYVTRCVCTLVVPLCCDLATVHEQSRSTVFHRPAGRAWALDCGVNEYEAAVSEGHWQPNAQALALRDRDESFKYLGRV